MKWTQPSTRRKVSTGMKLPVLCSSPIPRDPGTETLCPEGSWLMGKVMIQTSDTKGAFMRKTCSFSLLPLPHLLMYHHPLLRGGVAWRCCPPTYPPTPTAVYAINTLTCACLCPALVTLLSYGGSSDAAQNGNHVGPFSTPSPLLKKQFQTLPGKVFKQKW